MTGSAEKRYYFMDWLRTLSFAFIICYHFMIQLELGGNYNFLEKGCIPINDNKFHMAIIGVSLFFMLSGAGLMLSGGRKWSIKEFYLRRLSRILLPFYLVEIFAYLASSVLTPELLEDFPVTPKIRIILNVFALDGYMGQFGRTFGVHVGEWFLGALVILYFVFPLLRYCMLKNRYITIAALTVYYVLVCNSVLAVPSPWTSVFVKAYDFSLGMFFALELPKLRRSRFKSVGGVCALIAVVAVCYRRVLPVPDVVNNLIAAVCIFILFCFGERKFASLKRCNNLIRRICGISYEVFLVHHIVIIYLSYSLSGYLALRQVIVLFVVELIIMAALALVAKNVTGTIRRAARLEHLWRS